MKLVPFCILTMSGFAITSGPVSAPVSAQNAVTSQTLFDQQDRKVSAKVTLSKGRCTLRYNTDASTKGFSFSIGSSPITSTFIIFGSANIGAAANGTDPKPYTVERLTNSGWKLHSARFTKKSVGDGTFKIYQTELAALVLDLDDLEKTSAFRLSQPGSERLTVDFSDDFGKNSVAAMRKCVNGLPRHWSLKGA